MGSYPRMGEARCDCVEQKWLCLITDERFESACPMVHWSKLYREACPTDPTLTCNYQAPGSLSAACGCALVDGEDGAGGAANHWAWMCGL